MNKYFKSLNSFGIYLKEETDFQKLCILSINIRSVSSIAKFNKFKNIVAHLPILPAIICIQESWFQRNLLQLYNLPGYNNVHCCREDNYGGCSMYIRETMEYAVDLCESVNFIETIAITLCNQKLSGKSLKIMTYYRSPKCTSMNFYSHIDCLTHRFGRFPCIFVGDSNINFLDESMSQELNSIIESYDFKNCHTFITRPRSGTSIDTVFSNIYDKLKIDSIECKLSDHNMIFCRIESQYQAHDFQENVYTSYDYDLVKQHFRQNLQLPQLSGNPSSDTLKFVTCLSNAISHGTTEIKKRSLLKYQVAPWLNVNLQSLIQLKNKLLKLRRKSRTTDVDIRLKRLSKVIKIASKEAMNDYYIDKLSKIQHDPKKCWRFLNQTLGRKRKSDIVLKDVSGEMIRLDKDKAERLNQYFINSVHELRRHFDHSEDESWYAFRTLRRHQNFFRLEETNETQIADLISRMDVNKASGSDKISTKIILKCSSELLPYLVCLFNSSVNNFVFPDILKIQKIIPIPKESHSISVENYRPISILSTIDKIFEKILYQQFSSFLESEHLLSDNQYGFRKGCGTDEAVVNVVNYICDNLDRGYCGVGGMFYDFTKAFDLVDHGILIEKLSFYGCSGRELAYFKSYLVNRKQYVQVGSCRSSTEIVKSGVPQGSVLGPLLFRIYLNDINNIGQKGKIFLYADDLCILYPYHQETLLKSNISHDALLISKYAKLNKLVLNAGKTKFIRFKPQQCNINNGGIDLNGELIPEVTTVKYLGAYLQSNLLWHSHIEHLKSKVSPITGMLYKLRNKLNVRTKMMIFESLIQSKLRYLSQVYAHRRNAALKTLQVVQNKALKNIFKLPMTYSTLSLYKEVAVTVLPIYGIHMMQLLTYVYKVVHNIGYHTISLERRQNNFNTRHGADIRVCRCRLEITKQRIDYKGCVDYNNLPTFVKNSETISVFKARLKNHLLRNIETLLL